MATLDIIPCATVHPDRINLYSQVQWSGPKPRKIKYDHLVKSDSKHHGQISTAARRKISKALDYLLFMSNDKYLPGTAHGKNYKFKIAFITLTLPAAQFHSDNEIKEKCLNQFLIELKRYHNVRDYIWRAEKQLNGNLHFHILVNAFIPWSELRDRWNRIVNKLGYVEKYRDQMRQFHEGGFQVRKDLLREWEYKKQVKAYQAGKANDWSSPNSTDVHSLVKVNRVKNYISKYMSKDEKAGEVEGRMWGCSTELSSIPGGKLIADSHVKDEINHLKSVYPDIAYTGQYFTVVFADIHLLYKEKCFNLLEAFGMFMNEHFNFDVQLAFT